MLTSGAAAVGQWQGLPLEHEGGSGVAPSKERWPETNLRCVSTAGQRTTAAQQSSVDGEVLLGPATFANGPAARGGGRGGGEHGRAMGKWLGMALTEEEEEGSALAESGVGARAPVVGLDQRWEARGQALRGVLRGEWARRGKKGGDDGGLHFL
jgi:hypothetical protein